MSDWLLSGLGIVAFVGVAWIARRGGEAICRRVVLRRRVRESLDLVIDLTTFDQPVTESGSSATPVDATAPGASPVSPGPRRAGVAFDLPAAPAGPAGPTAPSGAGPICP